ncbi:hypothetical protein HN865_03970 [Candidatus Woesearchaeota archaeon]|jgi:hypothetical protein|nr:hypothetical protein [Candidatus Woesearchaeota archaeon]MBT7237989.1 hypothetical protein [Candidatus Woesearchaeota archaeon]
MKDSNIDYGFEKILNDISKGIKKAYSFGYAAPTYFRKNDEKQKRTNNPNLFYSKNDIGEVGAASLAGSFAGFMVNGLTIVPSLGLILNSSKLPDNVLFPALFIPFITNSISGIYEHYFVQPYLKQQETNNTIENLIEDSKGDNN